jgi:hypothetical protein
MIAATVMTSLMLPFLGGLFDPPPEAIVDNLLMCAAVHERFWHIPAQSIGGANNVLEGHCRASIRLETALGSIDRRQAADQAGVTTGCLIARGPC